MLCLGFLRPRKSTQDIQYNQGSVTNAFDGPLHRKGQEKRSCEKHFMKSLPTMTSTSYAFASLKIHYSLDKLNRRLATSL